MSKKTWLEMVGHGIAFSRHTCRKLCRMQPISNTVNRGYSVPPYKRNTNLRVGDEIAPLYSPSCTLCNSCTLRDIHVSSRPVPTCSALNSLCMDIRLQGVCAIILVRISTLRTSPPQDGIAPINLQRETATVASSALLFWTEGTVSCVK